VQDDRRFWLSEDRRYVICSDGREYAILKMASKPLYFLVEKWKVNGRLVVPLPVGLDIKSDDNRGRAKATPVVCKIKVKEKVK